MTEAQHRNSPAPHPKEDVSEKAGIDLSSRYLRWFCRYGVFILAALSVIMTWVKSESSNRAVIEIADRFILNNETSIPTVISFLLMVTAAQLATLIFIFQRRQQRSWLNLYWLLAALVLILLAYDEIAQVHESIPPPVFREVFLHHGWIFAGISVVSILLVMFVPFLRSLPSPLARKMLTAGAIFLFGAVVIEGVSGLYSTKMSKDFIYDLLTVLEESCELFGICFLNIALLDFIAGHNLVLRFSSILSGKKP
ncbi:hypothetical protein [Ruegeria atlantica]|uniref:hypothetical protein n=1 Tax=Ruegeria atlantica TaxID=81569 RepID=UPI00147EACB3|nr:hypothetical protein [Ruegeria atlantica]